jgi:hypothetical protein
MQRASRRQEVSLPLPEEPSAEEQTTSRQVWEIVQTTLPDEREQRLAYLLFHCGLGPQEIVRNCPQEWSDVREVAHLRHTILKQLTKGLI